MYGGAFTLKTRSMSVMEICSSYLLINSESRQSAKIFRMGIDFRKNANVLSAIHLNARPQTAPTSESPFVADGYELRATPELVDRLKELARKVLESSFSYVEGVPVLHTREVRIFATVGGKYHLSLFLPDEKKWGEANADYRLPWRTGIAWPVNQQPSHDSEQVFERLLRTAYNSAVKADQDFSR
jgi:hypothetical protein